MMKLYLTSKTRPFAVMVSNVLSSILVWVILLNLVLSDYVSFILLTPLYLWPLYSGMVVDWFVKLRK